MFLMDKEGALTDLEALTSLDHLLQRQDAHLQRVPDAGVTAMLLSIGLACLNALRKRKRPVTSP
jgi:hypothetical protein